MQRKREPYFPVIDCPQVAQGFQSSGCAMGARGTRELTTHCTLQPLGDASFGLKHRSRFIRARGVALQRRADEPVPVRLRELGEDALAVGKTKPLVLETRRTEGRQFDPGNNKAHGGRGRICWHE
jgi:hypothetical protein